MSTSRGAPSPNTGRCSASCRAASGRGFSSPEPATGFGCTPILLPSNPEGLVPPEVLRMQVNITFRNMFATDALRSHVTDKLSKVVDKYLDKVTEAHVTLSLERYLHHADINLHAGHFHVRGKEKSEDMYAAIDKIERQLKKHKERLKNHRPTHVHANGPVRVRYEVFSAKEDELGLQPEIIRSDEFLAKPMSVEEEIG